MIKNIKEFISEKLHINSNSNDRKLTRFRPDDDWTKDCLDSLIARFGNSYTIEQKQSGTIYFYKKGSKPSIKNLICSISGSNCIDFGPNDRLEKTLGKEILNTIDEV